MNLSEYQEKAMAYAEYDDEMYPFLALPEEVGEFLTPIAKSLRGDAINYEEYNLQLLKEAGDVLWQLTACINELGFTLEEVAQANIDKLASRKERGKIRGEGSER